MSSMSVVEQAQTSDDQQQRRRSSSDNDDGASNNGSLIVLDPPHPTTPTSSFITAALSITNQVVEATWKEDRRLDGVDTTVYTGLMGMAFTCLRSYQATGCQLDLSVAADIVHACTAVAHASRHVTFLCGKGGIYALGVVVMNYMGDQENSGHFLEMFHEVAQEKALPIGAEEGGFGMSYDLLYGRAGFLWAALFIRSYLGETAIPNDLLMPVVEAILAGGRAGASVNQSCPLMYRWHGTRYWGASHGLAGILHVLLHFPLSEQDAEDVRCTLKYMMSNRFPNSGNYPSSEGNTRDVLVQWSHGATSMAITLCKASQVFPKEREFRDGAIEAGEVVWKSGLVKRVGLADGVAGNAYAFLSLYRLTGDEIYIERAKAFASFLYHNGGELVRSEPGGSNHAYSLFLGLAGTACLFFDLLAPQQSRFPGYEL